MDALDALAFDDALRKLEALNPDQGRTSNHGFSAA
jgi:hypothetical protein